MVDCLKDNNLLQKIEEAIDKHGKNKSNLLAILLDVQSLIPEHYISRDAAELIGRAINVPVSKIYDVISFYSALYDQPRAFHVIQLCKSTCCKVNKYEKLLKIIEEELGIKVGQTTEDGMFAIEYSSCFGACDISPAIRIGHKVYGNLNEEGLKNLIGRYRDGQYE